MSYILIFSICKKYGTVFLMQIGNKLKDGDLLINAEDYGNFEKVGSLGFELPRNDKQTTTDEESNKGINIYGGRYGLSSKNTTPADIYSVYKFLETNPHHNFTVGITDDVTNLSIPHYDFDIEDNFLLNP